MIDIIVATQKVQASDKSYFKTFRIRPKRLENGSRIYYVETSYITGFGVVSEIADNGCRVTMPKDSWQWISPIEMRGFPGWMYFDIPRSSIEVVGDWLDPKPDPAEYKIKKYVKKAGGSPYLEDPVNW